MQVILTKKQTKLERTRNLQLLFHTSTCIPCKRSWQSALGQKISPKDKRGGTFFCVNLCGYQRPDETGRCPICKTKVVRQPTYEQSSERLRVIIDENRKLFDEKFDDRLELITIKELQIRIPIPIGKKLIFIPFELLIEFDNLDRTDRTQFESFFESIKKNCTSYDI